MRRLRAAGAFVGLLLLAGCQTPPPLRALAPEDPRPRALHDGWSRQVGERTALRGNARLAVDADRAGADGGDVRFRSRQALVLAWPASLRVEVRGLLGNAVAVPIIETRRTGYIRTASFGELCCGLARIDTWRARGNGVVAAGGIDEQGIYTDFAGARLRHEGLGARRDANSAPGLPIIITRVVPQVIVRNVEQVGA